MTAHGHARRLGSVTGADVGYTLAGSMLVYETETDSSGTTVVTVHWRNLRTNAHGTESVPDTGEIVAAPNGWVTTSVASLAGNRHTLILHTTTGHTRRLGQPSVRTPILGLSSGGNTLVVASGDDADLDGDGSAVAMSFTHPGHFHKLIAPNPRGEVICVSVTSSRISCLTNNTVTYRARLFSATGTQLVNLVTKCNPGHAAVLNKSLAWVTPGGPSCHAAHRLAVASHSHETRFSSAKVTGNPPVAAFNDVIVDNRSYSKLLAFSGPNHHRVIEGITHSGP